MITPLSLCHVGGSDRWIRRGRNSTVVIITAQYHYWWLTAACAACGDSCEPLNVCVTMPALQQRAERSAPSYSFQVDCCILQESCNYRTSTFTADEMCTILYLSRILNAGRLHVTQYLHIVFLVLWSSSCLPSQFHPGLDRQQQPSKIIFRQGESALAADLGVTLKLRMPGTCTKEKICWTGIDLDFNCYFPPWC